MQWCRQCCICTEVHKSTALLSMLQRILMVMTAMAAVRKLLSCLLTPTS